MTPALRTQNWLVRYRLYHIPFWLVYNYLTRVVVNGNPVRVVHVLLYLPLNIK
jgi:hypothetical protein